MNTVGDGANGTDRLPLTSTPRFVGRQREAAALAQILTNRPAVVLVEGEAGIGKTRLVQEFLASKAGRRQRSLVAGCPPFRQPYTLGPIVDATRQATDHINHLGLSGLAGALRPLFPEWSDDLPPAPEPLEDPAAARHRLFRALGELLDRLDVALLVVEDLHWADDATLEFLLFLATRQPPPMSLVLTYRPEDVPRDSLLLRLSSRGAVGAAGLRLTLHPLDVDETAAFVSSMLAGVRVSADFAAFLHERTAGVPLALEESVRLMHDRADLARREGSWKRRQLEAIDVPPTVRDAVLERAQRLAPDAQVMLEAAAVLIEPAAEATMVVVSGLPSDRADAALTHALQSGLLREERRGQFAFRHALAARAVYDTMPTPMRRTMHLRAAHALQATTPLPLARLATHFREAGENADWAHHAELAADVALAAGNGLTAALLLHDVLINVDLPVDQTMRLLEKVPFVTFTGPERFRDMVGALRAALEREKLPPLDEARARSKLGQTLMSTEEYEEAHTELRRAVEDLPLDSVDAIRSMMLLALPYGPASGAEHRGWLRRAAEAAAAIAPTLTPNARLFVTMEHAGALLLLGMEEGWAVTERIPLDVSTPTLRRGVAVAKLNTGAEAIRWGRYAQAQRLITDALEESERHEYLRLRDIALINQAQLDYFTGAWTGLAERAGALSANEDLQPVTRVEAVFVAGLLQEVTGAASAAEESLREAASVVRRHGATENAFPFTAALARLCLAAGRCDEAIVLTDWAVETIVHKDLWVLATDLATVRVEALVAVGRTADATALVTAFDRGLRGRTAPAPGTALTLCRAIVAQAGNHPQSGAERSAQMRQAARLFASAATAWESLPRPYDALLARERQARCLFAAGDTGAAVPLLADVLRGLSRLGAHPAAERVSLTLREHGVDARRLNRGGRPSYGDQLSPRERDVVRLLGDGRTNRQIATALVLSVRTVDSHLQSAMRKLRVTSRTALVVRAAELGLVDGDRPAASS